RSGRMRDGWISERTQDVHERVGVLVRGDVDQRLGDARRAGCREIREFNRRRDALLRLIHRRQRIEARVGHLRDADRRLALAVLAARRFAGAGHELKKRGLAAGTEADERCPEHAGGVASYCGARPRSNTCGAFAVSNPNEWWGPGEERAKIQ